MTLDTTQAEDVMPLIFCKEAMHRHVWRLLKGTKWRIGRNRKKLKIEKCKNKKVRMNSLRNLFEDGNSQDDSKQYANNKHSQNVY